MWQTPNCRNCGWGPHAREQCPAKNATCHYCQKVGHLAKVCLSKLRKKNVHEIEASSSNNALPNSESTQPISDCVLLGPIEATALSMHVHSISCREKALLEVSLLLEPEGRQVNALCNKDPGRNQHFTEVPLPTVESWEAEFSTTHDETICIWWNRDS